MKVTAICLHDAPLHAMLSTAMKIATVMDQNIAQVSIEASPLTVLIFCASLELLLLVLVNFVQRRIGSPVSFFTRNFELKFIMA